MVLANAEQVVEKPDDLSFEKAAAIPIVGVTALQAITSNGKLKPGQSVFINGCLGNVGRIAAQLALSRHITVAGSCRAGTRHDAEALGISPVVDFDFDPSRLQGRFDLVFDTAGTLSNKTARTLIKPGGHITDINGTPAKMLRSALPGPYHMQFTKASVQDLETITRAVADGQVEVPIARTVPLAEATQALAELETRNTPRGGKLVITVP
jgi:NADPH:quinone reductase-like Zn-dependent oxidoreductase